MLRLRDSIPEARIKTKINEIVDISGRIIKSAVEDSTDRASVKRFLNYYMPTTIKLLNSYDRMYSQGIEGTNISGTMTRIDEALDKIIDSYRRQLDALFADEALDIETDIKVLDTMLAREGLKEREF